MANDVAKYAFGEETKIKVNKLRIAFYRIISFIQFQWRRYCDCSFQLLLFSGIDSTN